MNESAKIRKTGGLSILENTDVHSFSELVNKRGRFTSASFV